MKNWKPKQYRNYKWIVQDPDYRGGSLRIFPDDIDILHVMQCLANGMTPETIETEYPFKLRPEVLAEIFSLGVELIEKESREKQVAS